MVTKIGVNTTIAVGTTSTQLVGMNPPRASLLIRNRGSASIYLGFGADASADDFEVAVDEDFQTTVASAIYAVAASGTVAVKVIEEVRA